MDTTSSHGPTPGDLGAIPWADRVGSTHSVAKPAPMRMASTHTDCANGSLGEEGAGTVCMLWSQPINDHTPVDPRRGWVAVQRSRISVLPRRHSHQDASPSMTQDSRWRYGLTDPVAGGTPASRSSLSIVLTDQLVGVPLLHRVAECVVELTEPVFIHRHRRMLCLIPRCQA